MLNKVKMPMLEPCTKTKRITNEERAHNARIERKKTYTYNTNKKKICTEENGNSEQQQKCGIKKRNERNPKKARTAV